MKLYKIKDGLLDHFFAVQDDAYKAARERAAKSYDPVVVEAVEPKHWPLTKRTFASILNGEDWHDGGKVIYTAKAGLTGERPAPESLPCCDQASPGPVGTPPSEPVGPCEPLHAESVVLIDPSKV